MKFLLVPHGATAATATIWVGAIDEDVRARSVELEFSSDHDSGVVELDASGWQKWKSYYPLDRRSLNPLDWLPKSSPEERKLYYQRVTIGLEKRLKPRTSYFLKLRIDGETVDLKDQLGTAQVTTLPAALPTEEEENPLTLLLGSCFYCPNDREGLVGKTYHHIPGDKKPDIKVLCGDQVYLDNPWRDTTIKWTRSYRVPGLFRATLFQKYEKNSTQVRGEDEDAGFRQLLRDGPNYFCPDDHEFWNNAPNFGGLVCSTRSSEASVTGGSERRPRSFGHSNRRRL
jgi:hypothetical protein